MGGGARGGLAGGIGTGGEGIGDGGNGGNPGPGGCGNGGGGGEGSGGSGAGGGEGSGGSGAGGGGGEGTDSTKDAGCSQSTVPSRIVPKRCRIAELVPRWGVCSQNCLCSSGGAATTCRACPRAVGLIFLARVLI